MRSLPLTIADGLAPSRHLRKDGRVNTTNRIQNVRLAAIAGVATLRS